MMCKRSDCTIDHEEQLARLKAFVAELTILSESFGFWIGGCGECGSPWVTDARNREPTDTIQVLTGKPTVGYTAGDFEHSIEQEYREWWKLHL